MEERSLLYERGLSDLKRLLTRARTATELMDLLECSKPTVYARISALEARGVKLKRTETRSGSRGPLAVAFRLK